MNKPQQPQDPPREPKKVDHDPGSPMQNGIPDGAKEDMATAYPTSDRQQTETAGSDGS